MLTFYKIGISPRCTIVEALMKHFDIPFETIMYPDPRLKEDFPAVPKAPALVADHGIKVQETLACIAYVLSLTQDVEAERLCGKNFQERALVLKWNSMTNQDLVDVFSEIILPIFGYQPFNKVKHQVAVKELELIMNVFEARLAEYTYLVNERVTVADLFACLSLASGFTTIFDKEWSAAHPSIYRWFNTVKKHPIISSFVGETEAIEKKMVYQPPKKEKAEKPKKDAPASSSKPAAKPVEQEDAPMEEKKPKHPLETLGRPKMAIDEWKRCYSNEETREVALPWFWEHFDANEWSLYKVGYKYNDELTLTFMSNNLVGGFFNRLSASTKYMFGCLVVYGENNNNGIIGAFMVRGQDYAPAFDVAPDWESYEYSKLDPTNEEDKDFVSNMWAWDKPVLVNGEAKEIADGKVFK